MGGGSVVRNGCIRLLAWVQQNVEYTKERNGRKRGGVTLASIERKSFRRPCNLKESWECVNLPPLIPDECLPRFHPLL